MYNKKKSETNINFHNIYDELRKHHGAINIVAARSGFHRNWVRRVLQGKHRNQKIVLAASRYLRDLKNIEAKAAQEINSNLREVFTN